MAEKPSCPICGEPPDPKFKPFCRQRCADIDLARWFRGNYTVPVVEIEEDLTMPDEDEL